MRLLTNPLKDTGSRDELIRFLKYRDENVVEIVEYLEGLGQYWKRSVFLELLWEYERIIREIRALKPEDLE